MAVGLPPKQEIGFQYAARSTRQTDDGMVTSRNKEGGASALRESQFPGKSFNMWVEERRVSVQVARISMQGVP